jgi:hypothetical protein
MNRKAMDGGHSKALFVFAGDDAEQLNAVN